MHVRSSVFPLIALFASAGFAAGCNSSQPPLTHATSLSCPTPGDLPFRLQSHGWKSVANQQLVVSETRSKDEATDSLGDPNGAQASIFIADNASPAPGPIDYAGLKARTEPDRGFFADPLPGEDVSLWTYDSGKTAWQMLGRTQTDPMGNYDLPSTGYIAPSGQPLYAMLEADGSCAAHYDYFWPTGTQMVVFDIDGTLTLSDNELLMQASDGSYTPALMPAADRLVQAWAQKGYKVVYLTARPHLFRAETRAWLDQLGFPNGPVITANSGSGTADVYKTMWLKRLITDFGWTAVAAYGNAETDITAYANVGIAPDVTFIVGQYGGESNTVAIANNDFSDHIASYVEQQPSSTNSN